MIVRCHVNRLERRRSCGVPISPVNRLPVLISVGRPSYGIWETFCEELPLTRISLLEGQAFPVWTVIQKDRVSLVVVRSMYVSPENCSVSHLQRHIPVDPHPFGKLAQLAQLSSEKSTDRDACEQHVLSQPAHDKVTRVRLRIKKPLAAGKPPECHNIQGTASQRMQI